MREPWKTRKSVRPEEVVVFPNTATAADARFEYESARILRTNRDNQLNLILFSLPVPSSISGRYVNSVRRILSRGPQQLKTELVQRFFAVAGGSSEQISLFADDVIRSSIGL